ncbi:MAG: hypothetical protein ACJAUM_000124 [Pseudomonadales bacterium]|jgi:hypothetical protein
MSKLADVKAICQTRRNDETIKLGLNYADFFRFREQVIIKNTNTRAWI